MATISPCIQVCQLNKAGFCTGCKRSVAEITAWSRMSDVEAAAIMAQLPSRVIDAPAPIRPVDRGGRAS